MRRTVIAGLTLALVVTAFIDLAVLSVPLYDMQLYDRVLQSRNMDTLGVLSVACVLGLVLYALLDYLRSACFVAIGEAVGRHLDAVVVTEGVRRAARGDKRAGPEMLRDLNELQSFVGSGAVAVPLDALCAPLFLAVAFMLHPVFGFVGTGGIALLVMAGLAGDWLVRPRLLAAELRRTEAGQELARRLAEPELADGLGMLPAIGRRWARRHGESLAMLNAAAGRALAIAGVARLLRLGTQSASMALGAVLVIAGVTTPGSLMGSNLLLNKMLAPFDHIVASWRHWALAHAAWRRVDHLLATAQADMPDERDPEAGPGLVLRNVGVTTENGIALLHGIDLAVPPGTILAVTGPNGAGKTTLLRLLAGLERASEGTALLDGVALHDGTGVGFLPQSVALLHGTIEQNIARFQDDGIAGAVAASRQAGVHESIGRLAKGYDTMLYQGGAALSGGMRQRVGLARALHGDFALIVLDEPDASLDAEGCAALLQALRGARDGGAIIVVTSHRPAIEAAADVVLTLRDGAVAALRHAEPRPAEPRNAEPARAIHLATA